MSAICWPFDTSTVSEWCGGYSDVRSGIHMGTDFGVPQGTPLIATGTGTIRTHSGSGGNGIDILTDDGLVIRNWHLSEFHVNAGDRVTIGQVIGLTGGAKGTWGAGNSTGPHLHWELRDNTNFSDIGWIDPRDLAIGYFDGSQATLQPVSTVGSQGEGIRGQGNDWTYWVPGTADQQTVQSRLAERGLYGGTIDGDLASDASVRAIKMACGNLGYFDLTYWDGEINKNLCYGILLLAQNHGGYSGFNNLFTDGHVWAAFDSGVANAIAIPTPPAPVTPEPVVTPTPEPAPEPVITPTPSPALTEPKSISPATNTQEKKPVSLPQVKTVTNGQITDIRQDVYSAKELNEAAEYDLVDIRFWNYAGERVIKSFAYALVAQLAGTGTTVYVVPQTAEVLAQLGPWYVLMIAGNSAIISLGVALSTFRNIVTIPQPRKRKA